MPENAPPPSGRQATREGWPRGGGEMGAEVRAFDWGTTPLGPVEGWPESLRTAVDLMLASRHPVYIGWGPGLISLFNDGYLPFVGPARQRALGLPYWDVWPGLSDDYRTQVEAVMRGEGLLFVDAPVPLAGRPGVPVTWFTFSWTPIRDESGQVAGFFCAALETTDKVLVGEELREREARESRLRDELERSVAERTAALHAEIEEHRRTDAARQALQRQLATAQEDERRRIARDLHDQTGQLLAALSLAVRAAADAGPLAPRTAERLVEVQHLADQLGRQVHELAVRLRPVALDDLGLVVAVGELTTQWSRHGGAALDVQTIGFGQDRLPLEIETVVYRVVQEALTNVAKHAQARLVSVVVSRHDRHVTAVIEDDGQGFDPSTTPRGRLGLVGMRERLEQLGGYLDIESTPGAGTVVIARVPSTASSLRPPSSRR